MSETPETKSVWRSVEFLSAHHAKHELRQHAERLERERDQARRDELDESKWVKYYFEACQNLERQLKEAREELKIALYGPDTESDQIGPCKRPDLCLIDHGHIPCPVCPNRKR